MSQTGMNAPDRDIGQRARPRIIVVNDDTTFLRIMGELLGEIEGYDVETCLQWQDAHRLVCDGYEVRTAETAPRPSTSCGSAGRTWSCST